MSPTLAVVKDLSISKGDVRKLVKVSDIFVTDGLKWKPFRPRDIKDFKPSEEYGIIRNANLVLHQIAALYEGSESDAREQMESSGRKVVPKRKSTSNPIVPLSKVKFADEEPPSKSKQIHSNADQVMARYKSLLKMPHDTADGVNTAKKAAANKESPKKTETAKKAVANEESPKKTETAKKAVANKESPKKTETAKKAVANKESPEKTEGVIQTQAVDSQEDLKEKVEDEKTSENDPRAQTDIEEAIKKAVKEAVREAMTDIFAKLDNIQFSVDNVPAGTLGLVLANANAYNASADQTAQKRKESLTPNKDLPKVEFINKEVWVASDRIMTKDEFNKAQEKLSMGTRLTSLAKIVLPGGLATHSLTGPTDANPHLMKITDEQVALLTALLIAMTWLEDKPNINEPEVKRKLRQLTYEARRPEASIEKKKRKGGSSDQPGPSRKLPKQGSKNKREIDVYSDEEELLKAADENRRESGEGAAGKRREGDEEDHGKSKERSDGDNIATSPNDIDTCADMFASEELPGKPREDYSEEKEVDEAEEECGQRID